MARKLRTPEGWTRLTWVDVDGKKWDANVPTLAATDISLEIVKAGGLVTRQIEGG